MTDYLKGKDAALMIAGLSLATFMQVLDSTIANVALPAIAGNLGASVSQGIWVLTFFMVFNAASIPLTGFWQNALEKFVYFQFHRPYLLLPLWCAVYLPVW